MASTIFSYIANLGYQFTSAIFGDRLTEKDLPTAPFPPKASTMNLPAKRSISQADREENDPFKRPPMKTRRLTWNSNAAQRVKQQSHSKKKAHSAAKRIAGSVKFRFSHEFVQMAVTWRYAMLEIPDELKCLKPRLGFASVESAAATVSTGSQLRLKTQSTLAEDETDITMTPIRREPITPMQQYSTGTPPSLSYSVSPSGTDSSRSPETPAYSYKLRGPSLQNSKFATPGYQPPIRTKSWGLADYPKQKQGPGGHNTVRIYLGDQTQPVVERKPELAFADIDDTDTEMEIDVTYSHPQGFTPTTNFDMQAEARRHEAQKVSFNAEARERVERDIDGRYYARWCLAIINAGELPYDNMRRDSEVLKSRWATHRC